MSGTDRKRYRRNRLNMGEVGMSKKRFVEFYLTAMLKAATDGRVRLSYAYFDLAHKEIVQIEYGCNNEVASYEVPVTELGLLEIATVIIDKIRGMQE